MPCSSGCVRRGARRRSSRRDSPNSCSRRPTGADSLAGRRSRSTSPCASRIARSAAPRARAPIALARDLSLSQRGRVSRAPCARLSGARRDRRRQWRGAGGDDRPRVGGVRGRALPLDARRGRARDARRDARVTSRRDAYGVFAAARRRARRARRCQLVAELVASWLPLHAAAPRAEARRRARRSTSSSTDPPTASTRADDDRRRCHCFGSPACTCARSTATSCDSTGTSVARGRIDLDARRATIAVPRSPRRTRRRCVARARRLLDAHALGGVSRRPPRRERSCTRVAWWIPMDVRGFSSATRTPARRRRACRSCRQAAGATSPTIRWCCASATTARSSRRGGRGARISTRDSAMPS